MEGGHGAEPALQVELGQRFQLTGTAQQLIAMLASRQTDVDATVDTHVEVNPALVRRTPRRCRWCAAPLERGRCPACSGTGADVRDLDPAAPLDARAQVLQDARALVPAGHEGDVELVMALLDERGLLPGGIEAVGGHPDERLRVALDAVRAVAPPGTGEPDLLACLLAQARWHAEHGGPALLVTLVQDHLQDLGDDGLAGRLGVTPAELSDARAVLRTRLTVAPLPLGGDDAALAPPDVVVREVHRRLVVEALDAGDLGLAVDDELAALPLGAEAARWRDAHVADARRLLYLLDHRADTLRRVTATALEVQEDFVRHGRAAHRPLTRAQVAGRLGLHPSTVSRVVHGAVVALPDRRVLPLAAFFGTAEAPREAVARLFASDDPPHSDDEARIRLAAQGVHLARRTVAKYRASEGRRRAAAT